MEVIDRRTKQWGRRVSGLQYFTHIVDEHVYGAWYRIISPTEIEVIGVGLLESADYAGFSPESAAKSVLENYVRQRISQGVPIPNLDALPPIVRPADGGAQVTALASTSTVPGE